jgi:hypothetical protein
MNSICQVKLSPDLAFLCYVRHKGIHSILLGRPLGCYFRYAFDDSSIMMVNNIHIISGVAIPGLYYLAKAGNNVEIFETSSTFVMILWILTVLNCITCTSE